MYRTDSSETRSLFYSICRCAWIVSLPFTHHSLAQSLVRKSPPIPCLASSSQQRIIQEVKLAAYFDAVERKKADVEG